VTITFPKRTMLHEVSQLGSWTQDRNQTVHIMNESQRHRENG